MRRLLALCPLRKIACKITNYYSIHKIICAVFAPIPKKDVTLHSETSEHSENSDNSEGSKGSEISEHSDNSEDSEDSEGSEILRFL